MLKQKLEIKVVLLAVLLVIPLFPFNTVRAQSLQNIIITEAQTGGWQEDGITEDPHKEFIELYNPNQEPVNLNGWQLQFLTATHSGGETPTRVIANLGESDIIEPLSLFVVSADGYIIDADYIYSKYSTSGQLPKTGGSARLVNNEKAVIDIVGYGNAQQYLGEPAIAPSVGDSIQRCSNNGYISTDNNKIDFSLYSEVTPGAAIACIQDEPEPTPEPEPDLDTSNNNQTNNETTTDNNQDPIIEPVMSCEGLYINEVLPNPAGSDSGYEYVEIYNPTNDYIYLSGCKLQFSASTKEYIFNDIELAPGQYHYFTDTTTGLTLPNSAGGSVYLISVNNQEISTVTYPADLADDVAWANFDNTWQETFMATPGLKNILQVLKPCPVGQIRNPETNRCINEVTVTETSALQPCPAGQERNPATNRCRLVNSTVASLTPCKPGQIRNPETNRCKNAAEAFSTLTPCKPGQERNPLTNRCRNIVVTAALKSCPAGQERNPDTGRCRKVLPATNDSLLETLGVTDVPSSPGSTNGIKIALITASAALTYGFWGWRQDISNFIYRFRNKSKDTVS